MKYGQFRVMPGRLAALGLWLVCRSALGADEPTARIRAGDLQLTLRSSVQGVSVQSLADSKQGHELLAAGPWPLFTLALRQTGSTGEVLLASNQGWRQCVVTQAATRLELRWSEPAEESLAGLAVRAIATFGPRQAQAWELRW